MEGAAVDRSVDVDSIKPKDLVVWRDSSEPLFRYDNRPPKVIFKEGFAPKDPQYTDLTQLVRFSPTGPTARPESSGRTASR